MDKNRELHELLGLQPRIHRTSIVNFKTYPEYYIDPLLVLREMQKRDDWMDFSEHSFDGDYDTLVDLMLYKTGKLIEMAIEWLKEKA